MMQREPSTTKLIKNKKCDSHGRLLLFLHQDSLLLAGEYVWVSKTRTGTPGWPGVWDAGPPSSVKWDDHSGALEAPDPQEVLSGWGGLLPSAARSAGALQVLRSPDRPWGPRPGIVAGPRKAAGRGRRCSWCGNRSGGGRQPPARGWTPAPRVAAERSARNLLTGPEQRAANPAGGRGRAGGRRDPPLLRAAAKLTAHSLPAGRSRGRGQDAQVPTPTRLPSAQEPPPQDSSSVPPPAWPERPASSPDPAATYMGDGVGLF